LPAPAVPAFAQPLELLDLSIPVSRIGHHEIEIGRAWLPNGILSEIVIEPGPGPTDAIFGEDGVGLVVWPTDPSRPRLRTRKSAPRSRVSRRLRST
jgi:hypothetical protein